MRATPLKSLIRCLIPAAILVMAGVLSAQPLPDCYYTRAGLDTFIHGLARDYPQRIKVDSIGHSNGEMLGVQYPIYAVTVSSNPQVFQDKPTALIIGHIHGEEVIGLQVTMNYLWRICHQFGLYRELVNNTQLYFIPTINPDALEVISRGNMDMTWRKNGYVPPELNGRDCNVISGAGWDSCGVDINRNMGFNWIYGDSLWLPASSEVFDYYRGPAPFSEPEAQCLRDFATQIKPTVSVIFHSSRQGGNANRSIVPWEYGPDGQFHKTAPDCTAIGFINNLYCNQFGIRYHMAFGSQRNGNLQDWFYKTLGTFQFNTELGPPIAIQPPCTTLTRLINEDVIALNWMNTRLLNLDQATMTPLTIRTYDAGTTPPSPISAEWRNLNTWNPILGPWYTNAQFGSATLLPMPGAIQIMTRKEGYVTQVTSYTVQPMSSPDSITILMQPLPWYYLTLRIRGANGQLIPGRVYLDSEFPHWVNLPTGEDSIRLPQASFKAMAEAFVPDRMALWQEFTLGGSHTVEFWLPPSTAVLTETFEAGLGNWTVGGTGNPWNVATDTTTNLSGQNLVTYPLTGYRAQYDNNLNSWIRYNPPVSLGSANVAYLSFNRRGRLDYPGDSLFVEVSPQGTDWQVAAGFSDLEIPWTSANVNLSPWAGNSIYLRFRFKTDSALGDLGLSIDNLVVYKGTDADAPDQPVLSPYTYRITGSYPNPFNPTTRIAYEVANPGPVTLVFFNSLGQEVRRFDVNATSAGPQHLLWDGTTASGRSVASGLYFVQLQAPNTLATHKLLLLR
jgi:hypothetical protein